MITDSFFLKGQSHDICQDYALDGSYKGLSYAMISDGCSMIADPSGQALAHPLSDVASRIACLSAEKVLKHLAVRDGRPEVSDMFFELLAAAMNTHARLFEKDSLLGDATLSVLTAKEGMLLEIRIGDGILVVEKWDTVDVYVVKFTPNFPPYCSYLMSQDKLDNYNSKGVVGEETRYTISKETGECEDIRTREVPATIMSAMNVRVMGTEDVVSASVFSDGLTDMVLARRSPVLVRQAALEMLNIKSVGGQFVRRRMKAMARKQATAMGPNDDLSMAMIRFNHE